MAVINDPNTASNIARVGMASGMVWTPQHEVSGPLPVGAGGAYRLGLTTGTIAASLAANSDLFQFRYVTSNSRICLVHGIAVSAGMITTPTAGTTPVPLLITAVRHTSWTVDGTGGTAATLTSSNKMRTAHANSEVSSARIATTAALGGGTKTPDNHPFGSALGGIYFDLAAGDVNNQLLAPTNLLGEFVGGMSFPLTLANQEGFSVRTGIAMPATMTWNLTVNVSWSEVDGF